VLTLLGIGSAAAYAMAGKPRAEHPVATPFTAKDAA
jgi:hypothetical protein